MSENFRTFIQRLVAQTGTQATIAAAIGMSASAFSRGVHKEGTLDVMNCLRLAKWAGESPAYVLRVAGKGDLADIVEELFGPARSPISGRDRSLMDLWHRAEHEIQDAILGLLRAVDAQKPTAASRQQRRA